MSPMKLKVLQIIDVSHYLIFFSIPFSCCSKMSENLFALRSRLLLKMRKLFGDENVNWKAENSLSHNLYRSPKQQIPTTLYLIESIGKYKINKNSKLKETKQQVFDVNV